MTPWGTGDLVAVGSAVLVAALGVSLPQNRDWDRVGKLLANGLAIGPLGMIVLSPLFQVMDWKPNLLDIAVSEGRATLWYAAAYTVLQLVREIV